MPGQTELSGRLICREIREEILRRGDDDDDGELCAQKSVSERSLLIKTLVCEGRALE